MKVSSLIFINTLLAMVVLLSSCDRYAPQQVASAKSVSNEAEIVHPELLQPLDLTMTPEMLEPFVVESDDLVTEQQAQLQLHNKKENDVQFKGRLLLETRESALMPSIEGAVVEIEVKTRSL